MNRSTLLLAAIAAALPACGGGEQEMAVNEAGNQATSANEVVPGEGAVKPAGAAAIQLATKEPYGQYLVDASGRAVYVLEGSRQGPQAAAGGRSCTGECLAEWPPVVTQGTPTAGQGVNAGQLGTTAANDAQQVTYAGWPLYYYRGDAGQGSTSGQEIHDRWGGWYLLSPQGERIEGRETGPSAQ